MKCYLVHVNFVAAIVSFMFFILSGVICLTTYFTTEKINDAFAFERISLLVVGIVHFCLLIPVLFITAYTIKLMNSYLASDDYVYEALWNLLGMSKRGDGLDFQSGDFDSSSSRSGDSYLIPKIIVHAEETKPTHILPIPTIIEKEKESIIVHNKRETEIVRTELPSTVLEKVNFNLSSPYPVQSLYDILKVNQLGTLLSNEKIEDFGSFNDLELKKMREAMESVRTSDIDASRTAVIPSQYREWPKPNGFENRQHHEVTTLKLTSTEKLEEVLFEDVDTILEVLGVDWV